MSDYPIPHVDIVSYDGNFTILVSVYGTRRALMETNWLKIILEQLSIDHQKSKMILTLDIHQSSNPNITLRCESITRFPHWTWVLKYWTYSRRSPIPWPDNSYDPGSPCASGLSRKAASPILQNCPLPRLLRLLFPTSIQLFLGKMALQPQIHSGPGPTYGGPLLEQTVRSYDLPQEITWW